jgi:hypothetical protein
MIFKALDETRMSTSAVMRGCPCTETAIPPAVACGTLCSSKKAETFFAMPMTGPEIMATRSK